MQIIRAGYDATDASAEAVRWAAYEASVRGVRLQIMSCYAAATDHDTVSDRPDREAITVLVEGVRSSLEGARCLVASTHPGLDTTIMAMPGPPSISLLDGVDPDDLMVVGASHHHGLGAFWFGRTPRAVVRHSPCPVVIVNGAVSRGRPDRVVVGVDDSASSLSALRWAADEADLHQTELVVVHGWSYGSLTSEANETQAHDVAQVDAALLLDHAVETARERCGATVEGQLVEAAPATAVLDSIRDGDLLVLGSRGRGVVATGVCGSTVNSVLERCKVPVVVV